MTHRSHRTRRRATAAGLAALLLVGAAACGDDDDGDDGDEGAAAEFDLAAYCETEVALDDVFTGVDFEDPESMKAAAVDLDPLIEDLEGNAPEELADEVVVFREFVDGLAVDGDASKFEELGLPEIDTRVHAYDVENCGWQTVAVTATDYQFELAPPTSAGPVSFELSNEGAEAHVLIIGKKHDDVEGTALEAFETVGEAEDPEAAFGESFDEVGDTFAPPGGDDYFVRDLDEGEYILLCPIPVGTTGDAEGTGPPHFTQGMIGTFTIE